jgi:hypothetical protein
MAEDVVKLLGRIPAVVNLHGWRTMTVQLRGRRVQRTRPLRQRCVSRPGPPRKNGKRHANGRLICDAIVTGTPEIERRRRLLAGRGGDVTKTSSPIDLMELHKVIDEDQAPACSWFAYSARAVLGPPARKNILNVEPAPRRFPKASCGG